MSEIDFFAIVERFHTFQNPTSEQKLDLLIRYCDLADHMRVLDVGCGKAWLLRRMATRHAIHGVGVERHPIFVAEATEYIRHTPLKGTLEIIQTRAAQFSAASGAFDVALCIGASFAIGSFEQMLTWLRPLVKSGGVLAIGDIYARGPAVPPQSAVHFSDGVHRTLTGTLDMLAGAGLKLIGLIDSSKDEWDAYESLHWMAADFWLRTNPNHPNHATFMAADNKFRENYLAFDRNALGWAIWVCRAN